MSIRGSDAEEITITTDDGVSVVMGWFRGRFYIEMEAAYQDYVSADINPEDIKEAIKVLEINEIE